MTELLFLFLLISGIAAWGFILYILIKVITQS